MSKYWQLGEGATVIPQNADMHNYITPGNYSCSTSESISTLKNCPVDAAFIMKAYYSNGGGDPNYVYLIQEYITFDGKQRALSIYNNEAGKITWSTVKYPTKDDLSKSIYKSYSNIVIDSSSIPNYAIIDSFANMGVPSGKQVTGLCVRGWASGTGYFQVCKTSDGESLVLVAPAGTFGQLGVEVTYK